jgi:RHS repeat-associated protein
LVYRAGTTQQPFTWNAAYGYEWDCFAGTGLYHVGAREYDPCTARWLQRDPIDAASGDPNLYRYCGNDPVSRKDTFGSEDSQKKRPHDTTPTYSGNYRRDCEKVIDELGRAIRDLKKDVDNWYKLYTSGQKTRQDPGHAQEVVNRCVNALKALSKALRQCSEQEIASNSDWQTLVKGAFDYLYRHCNPYSENNPVLQGASSKKLNELEDVYKKSPVYTYEPGLVDMSFLLVPPVVMGRCSIGAGALLQGIIEWLSNLFPKPQPQPQPVPKEKKKAA